MTVHAGWHTVERARYAGQHIVGLARHAGQRIAEQVRHKGRNSQDVGLVVDISSM